MGQPLNQLDEVLMLVKLFIVIFVKCCNPTIDPMMKVGKSCDNSHDKWDMFSMFPENGITSYIHAYLVGVLEHFLFFHSVGNVMIPTDEVIFFRGVAQPPTRYYPQFKRAMENHHF